MYQGREIRVSGVYCDHMIWRVFFFSLVLTCLVPAMAGAQGGNVFSPEVEAGDRSWEWRAGGVLEAESQWGLSTRLHYQHAFDDRFRLRGVVQFASETGERTRFDFARAELLWQYREETPSGYAAGFRFDARLNEGNGPHRLGVNWAHQWNFESGWRGRAILIADQEVGSGAGDGLRLSSRSQLTYRLDNGLRIGAEAFSRYGNLSDGLPGFDRQRHTVGPVASGAFNEQWRWYAGAQMAVSDAARDQYLRLRIYRRF